MKVAEKGVYDLARLLK